MEHRAQTNETRVKTATWKQEQKEDPYLKQGKTKVPSPLFRSCLLQAAPPGQGLRRRPPARSCTSAHCRISQTGCYHAGWRSVSRPAEAHTPLIPEERERKDRQTSLHSTSSNDRSDGTLQGLFVFHWI